jgi:hypothetical protein
MATKRPDNVDEFMRKQQAKRAGLPLAPPRRRPTRTDNTPDLPALTAEEEATVETARANFSTVKKTFEGWMGIAAGLRTLKRKAERYGGKQTFDRLREREGLGGKDADENDILNKTRVSRLLSILDKEAEVAQWRHGLKPKQRFAWSSPEAVWRHAVIDGKPLFRKPSNKPPRASANADVAALKKQNEQLQARNTELQEELDGTRAEASPIQIATDDESLTCTFCGKNGDQVLCLIRGSEVRIGRKRFTGYICNECADICTGIVAEQKAKKGK